MCTRMYAPAGDANEPVDDPLAFLSGGGQQEPTFARKKASEVIGLDSSAERAHLIQELETLAGQRREQEERGRAHGDSLDRRIDVPFGVRNRIAATGKAIRSHRAVEGPRQAIDALCESVSVIAASACESE